MKYYIISGEASGDLHGSNLVKALIARDAQAVIRAWGGDLMAAAGAEVVKHYRDLAFMGFAEVAANIRTIMRNFKFCKKDILDFQPDVVILIDYPGFNLRMAEFAKEKGFKVFYYISPQVWAWKQNRVKKIKAYVDELFVILPFEKEFYARHGMEAHFVGHPLIDAVEEFRRELPDRERFTRDWKLDDRPIALLLPGSRKQEIQRMLPLMLKVADSYPSHQFIVAAAPGQELDYYRRYMEGRQCKIISGKTYELLNYADAAMVTSGTATLETAIFRVPQVVCYKGGYLSYLIAKRLVKVKYISLVNLIMDREVVVELIQNELNFSHLKGEFGKLVQHGEYRDKLMKDYEELYRRLGGRGASELTAELMLKKLNS
jgi:lipid-A-disaccharide synthase